MKVLMELPNFRLITYGYSIVVEIDAGIGAEGRYWIPASGVQLFDFVKELGESLGGKE